MADKIRILTVDDSAFMRKAIEMMVRDEPDIEVIASACDGKEGLEKVLELKPDLVTMDIEMPTMDGLTALRRIMKECPTPVIMVSSLTSEGAKVTLDALDLGAVDFIAKQSSFVSLDITKIRNELLEKIKQIHSHRRTLMARFALKTCKNAGKALPEPGTPKLPKPVVRKSKQVSLVAIGTSTGGPPALQSVLTHLPHNFPTGIVIVQHMPPTFTKSLAERLDSLCSISVKEAEDGEQIQRGVAYVAPGDSHLLVKKMGARSRVALSQKPENTLHKPSVDVLMQSVSDGQGSTAVGVIMTGMGSDGLIGLSALKSRGGDIIAEAEESCVVYGMPRAVVEAGIANAVVPLEQIPSEIMAYF